jgi:hypothetical protein
VLTTFKYTFNTQQDAGNKVIDWPPCTHFARNEMKILGVTVYCVTCPNISGQHLEPAVHVANYRPTRLTLTRVNTEIAARRYNVGWSSALGLAV